MLDHGHRRTRPLIRWLAAAALSLAANLAWAGTATLSWTPPIEYTNGDPLEVAGYRLFERCGADAYGTPIAVPAPASTHTRTDLPDGTTCWWQLTALDALGVESERSVEVFKVFPAAGEPPGAPGSLVVTWLGQDEPEPPSMTVTVHQTQTLRATTGALSFDVSFDTTPTVGRLAVVLLSWANGFQAFVDDLIVTDNQGNTYTQRAGQGWGSIGTRVYTAPIATASGTFTVTLEFDTVEAWATGVVSVSIVEVSGHDAADLIDASGAATGNSTTSAVDLASMEADTMVFAVASNDWDLTPTPASGWTAISTASGSGATALCTMYREGNNDPEVTWNLSNPWYIAAIGINADAGGGPVTLTIQDATHGHSVDNVALTQANTLSVADAVHAHVVDSPTLTQAHILAVADALHSHAVDAVALTQANTLTVADTVHAHAVDNVALVQSHILAVADALHAHAADNVSLTQAGTLTVADAVHAHAVDSVAITQANVLVVQSTDHGHAVDHVVLSESQILAVADALHAHAVDAVALTQAHVLAIHDAAHGHLVDALDLTQAAVLVVDDALHAHLVDAVTLRLPGSLGAATLFVVQAADRVLVVAPSQRYFTVH